MRVVAYTPGRLVPSARYRVRALIPALERRGIAVTESPAPIHPYPPRFVPRLVWGGALLAARAPSVVASYRYDAVILQREMIPKVPSLEALTKGPRILDIDDAIHLRGRGLLARTLATHSNAVVCGNSFLADYYQSFCKHVTIIPTTVDTSRFVPRAGNDLNLDRPVIGWVGTETNLHYVEALQDLLGEVIEKRPDVLIRIVCDAPARLPAIPDRNVEFVRWNASTEVETIQAMTIGIMPLSNGPWEAGKCSFKMLQYMACGIPVVVSDVGMNSSVLRMGGVGIGIVERSEWTDALLWLIDDRHARARMGRAGRQVVQKHFDNEHGAALWSSLLGAFAARKQGCLQH